MEFEKLEKAIENLEKRVDSLNHGHWYVVRSLESQIISDAVANRVLEGIAANEDLSNHIANWGWVYKRIFAAGVFYYGVKWTWEVAMKIAGWESEKKSQS